MYKIYKINPNLHDAVRSSRGICQLINELKKIEGRALLQRDRGLELHVKSLITRLGVYEGAQAELNHILGLCTKINNIEEGIINE